MPQTSGRTGPSWGRSPSKLLVLQAPHLARRTQSVTGQCAPVHPLLGESFCPSPSSLSSLSLSGSGVSQEVQGRRQRQRERERRRRAGWRISSKGHQRRPQGDHPGAAPNPLRPPLAHSTPHSPFRLRCLMK